MPNMPKISESEWEIMKVVWRQSPLIAEQIVSQLSNKIEWSDQTVKNHHHTSCGKTNDFPDIKSNRKGLLQMNFAIKIKNKIRSLVAVPMATLIVFGTIGAPSTTPVAMAAKTAGQTDSIESVFKLSSDWGLIQAVNKGLVTKTNQSVTKNGVTVTVKEILFDEAQLTVGYLEHVAADRKQEPLFRPVIWNGEEMHSANFSDAVQIDDQTTAHFLTVSNMGKFPDQFEMKLREVRVPEADSSDLWELAIPVKKVTKETTVLKPMMTKSSGDTTYTIKEIAITPSSTAVKFELKHPKYAEEFRYHPAMKLEDETGMIYEDKGLSFGKYKPPTEEGYSNEHVFMFSPFQTVPKSIKIGFVHDRLLFEYEAKPERYEAVVEHKPTAEKPIVLKRSKSGLVKINDIRYGKDKTEIRFQTEGPDPYRVSLWLKADGEEWFALKKVVDPKTYTFVAEFPALPSNAKLTITSTEIREPNYVPELAMTIPVKS
ncbi:DUF5643 domain-containing protein [Paenibacillus elgii]|uniref:DUF5643 domain-containing protein n=1 Tax=Paenibacillus elgii TaxID=189691 RepID=UPI00167AC023|nr:DUF4179 domain-containing protein [Paenibacillus elgii]